MGSQRVRHDWSDIACMHAEFSWAGARGLDLTSPYQPDNWCRLPKKWFGLARGSALHLRQFRRGWIVKDWQLAVSPLTGGTSLSTWRRSRKHMIAWTTDTLAKQAEKVWETQCSSSDSSLKSRILPLSIILSLFLFWNITVYIKHTKSLVFMN